MNKKMNHQTNNWKKEFLFQPQIVKWRNVFFYVLTTVNIFFLIGGIHNENLKVTSVILIYLIF